MDLWLVILVFAVGAIVGGFVGFLGAAKSVRKADAQAVRDGMIVLDGKVYTIHEFEV